MTWPQMADLEYLAEGKWLMRLERNAFLRAKAAATDRLEFSRIIPVEKVFPVEGVFPMILIWPCMIGKLSTPVDGQQQWEIDSTTPKFGNS